MRKYFYREKWKELLTPNIVALLTQIHEYKGEQNLFIEVYADTLNELVEAAKIQSTKASNKMEGIDTTEERLKQLVLDKTLPRTRNEQEIAGYRDVLNTVHESYEHIPPKPPIILQLHRDLYKFGGLETGGKYKSSDNLIAETDAAGNKRAGFQPISARETSESIEKLCEAYEEIVTDEKTDPLLIIPMFVLDFLCIHPFNDGNGRMSRLLTLLLLYRAGYIVGKYISIEKCIESTKEAYYDALQKSSQKWHEEMNDYTYFVEYMLGVIVNSYRDFSSGVILLTNRGLSKPERIRELIKENFGKITKAEIMKRCPDISQITIQRTLNELQKNGEIIKISGGRYTSYIWNREEKKNDNR